MKQYILTTLFSVMAFSLAAQAQQVMPLAVTAEGSYEVFQQSDVSISEDNANVSVTVRGAQVQVHAVNCQGNDLKVYDLVGKLKYETHIDTSDKTIRLQLSKGVYLVNVGRMTRRVSVVG